jgi:hypothetical protein
MQHQQSQAPCAAGNSGNKSVSIGSQLTSNDMLKIATVVHQIMTELSEATSEKDKITVITKMVLNLMKQNGC